MSGPAASLGDTPAAQVLDEVVVTSDRTGPGMWHVHHGNSQVWILGSMSPLPKDITWRSKQVDQVLTGTNEVVMVQFLAHPWNALLMAAFASILLYHMSLGLQVVVDDYVHGAGARIFCLLLIRFVVIATISTCLFALIRIAAST